MEECEVEILEPQESWEKEIAQQVILVENQIPIQTIIVNNEQQVIMGEAYALVCPKCNTIVKQFPAGIPEVEIIKSLNTDDNKLLHSTIYCKACGQKLKIMRPTPMEAEYVVPETVD